MKDNKNIPLAWVPSLYFAEGLPYMMVVIVSTIMYKNMGISNSQLALFTSGFYLPWVIKPLWSPFVESIKRNRFWVIAMQFTIGILFALVGMTLITDNFFRWSVIIMWLIAFSSATHDIAADGFYIEKLDSHQQSLFVGIRSLFYRISMIVAQGAVVAWVGHLSNNGKTIYESWKIAFLALAVLLIIVSIYHYICLPNKKTETTNKQENPIRNFILSLKSFFQKKGIVPSLLFILFYRLGEAQLSKMATPFLLDDTAVGGLGLQNEQVGFAYGTIGVLGLIIGGVSGGFVVAKQGLKFWIWPMAIAMNAPDLAYILLAHFQPENIHIIQSAIFVEQLGYGFGFTAFMLYLLSISKGEHSTAHYAFATGIMAFGMMLPGMVSGYIQELMGYQNFFIWVTICTLPGFLLIPWLRYDNNFGKK